MSTTLLAMTERIPSWVPLPKSVVRRQLFRLYFLKLKYRYPLGVLALGLLALPSEGGWWLTLLGVLGGALYLGLREITPSDQAVDAWFEEDIARLEKTARARAGLEGHLDVDGHELGPALTVFGPCSGRVPGVSSRDLLFRRGRDKRIRGTVSRVLIVLLAKEHLATYLCTVNRLRDLVLDVSLRDYRYRDIVAIGVDENVEVDDGERRKNYRIGSESFRPTQIFRMAISNGDEIAVPVQVAESGGQSSDQPPTRVDQMVRRLRAHLRQEGAT